MFAYRAEYVIYPRSPGRNNCIRWRLVCRFVGDRWGMPECSFDSVVALLTVLTKIFETQREHGTYFGLLAPKEIARNNGRRIKLSGKLGNFGAAREGEENKMVVLGG